MTQFVTENKYLFFVFISGMGFSLQAAIVKLLELQGFDGIFLSVFSRGAFQFLISTFVVFFVNSPESPRLCGSDPRVQRLMTLRAILGFGGVVFPLLTVQRLPVGDSSVLMQLSPLFASILGAFVLSEPWRLPELSATLIALIGAVLVVRPPFLFESVSWASYDILGLFFGIGGAICGGGSYVVIRLIGTTSNLSWANICLAQAIAQIILTAPTASLANRPLNLDMTPYQLCLIAFGGIFGSAAQALMTIGMTREKSTTASAMRMSDVIFAYLWQVLITNDKISQLSILGASLVAGSIIIVIKYKSPTSVHNSEEKSSSDVLDSSDIVSGTAEETNAQEGDIDEKVISNTVINEWKVAIKSRLHSLSSNVRLMSLPRYCVYSELSQLENSDGCPTNQSQAVELV